LYLALGAGPKIINPHFPILSDSRVTNLATQWIHTFHANLINELRVGFNISDDDLTFSVGHGRTFIACSA
jgi:hypothetical protein